MSVFTPVMFANADRSQAMEACFIAEARQRADGLFPQYAATYVVPLYSIPEVSATTQKLIDMLIQRDQMGRTKYGTTLDRTDLTLDQWLQHQVEELLDGAGYALAAMRTNQEQGK